MEISRLDLEKARTNVHQKRQICEVSKQSYASQLETTNKAKHDYYNISLPQLLEEMRRLDVDRINFTKTSMLESIHAETGVLNIIKKFVMYFV